MSYFHEVINFVYLLKLLNDIGKWQIIAYLNNSLITDGEDPDFDVINEAAWSVIGDLFEQCDDKYYESRCLNLAVLSDKVITDYYQLAGEYGKEHGVADESNPYILAAEKEAVRQFDFSYSLDFKLQAHTVPGRAHRSRLAIFMYEDDYVDITGVAIGTAKMYQFFAAGCEELRKRLSQERAAEVIPAGNPEVMEAAAA